MPEQLTKHPEVTIDVLTSAGALCGKGAPQQILKACPVDRFCRLPGGEICVYGLGDAARMTQIDRVDWQRLSSEVATATPADAPAGLLDFLGAGAAIGAAVGLLAGVAIGAAVARRAARRR